MQTTQAKVVARLTELWHATNREMVAAPADKIGSQWWNDREDSLAYLDAELNRNGVYSW